MLTKEEIQRNKESVLELLARSERQGTTRIMNWLERSDYFTAPASTSYHGNFEGGLAAHSLKVYEEFARQIQHYGLEVPEESQIFTGLLHDACKIGLYIPNVLKGGKASDTKPYKVEDHFVVGHGEKSIMMIQQRMDLTEQEMMIIRWHMGPYDRAWEDYKDKVIKHCPEAVLFHHVDMDVSQFYGL
jgi:hypothetical protein